MKHRILVVSSANIDFVQRMAQLPRQGETVVEHAACKYVAGGKGSNSAVTFARLGADTVFCAKVGKDENGARLKYLYAEEGMDTRFVFEDPDAPTGLASILVEEADGANRIIVYPGANGALTPEDVEEAFTCYPDGVFVQLEVPVEAVYAAARFAREKEIPLFVDAGPVVPEFDAASLGCAEIFSPNETECQALTGIVPDSVENCLKAAIRLAGMVETKYVVLKLGSRGAFIYDGKYYHVIPAQRVHAVDTTAAGDVFTAALSYAYLQKGDILEAARFATYAAALSVTREGAVPSVPTLQQVKEFAARKKEETC